MIGSDNHFDESKAHAYANPSSICSENQNAVVMITYDETNEIKTILVSIFKYIYIYIIFNIYITKTLYILGYSQF